MAITTTTTAEQVVLTLSDTLEQTQNDCKEMEKAQAELQEVSSRVLQALREDRSRLLALRSEGKERKATLIATHSAIVNAKQTEIDELNKIKTERLEYISNKTAKAAEINKEIEEVKAYNKYLKEDHYAQEAAYVSFSAWCKKNCNW